MLRTDFGLLGAGGKFTDRSSRWRIRRGSLLCGDCWVRPILRFLSCRCRREDGRRKRPPAGPALRKRRGSSNEPEHQRIDRPLLRERLPSGTQVGKRPVRVRVQGSRTRRRRRGRSSPRRLQARAGSGFAAPTQKMTNAPMTGRHWRRPRPGRGAGRCGLTTATPPSGTSRAPWPSSSRACHGPGTAGWPGVSPGPSCSLVAVRGRPRPCRCRCPAPGP